MTYGYRERVTRGSAPLTTFSSPLQGIVSRSPQPAATIDISPFTGDGYSTVRAGSTRVNDPTAIVTPEKFITLLEESGLLPPEEMSTLRASVPLYATAEALAESIYRLGKLTKYQLNRVVQGKAKSLFLGNYVVLDKIGQGGMGLVVKARHRVMQRIVAIKLLSATTMKSPDAIRRFHREVEAAARLNHPNIVAAFDADQANGTHFLVMEFVDGCNLAHLIRLQGPLSIKRSIEFLLQAGRGLEFAHSHGIVHRDIKPGNLLVDRAGVVKILDLGLARHQNDEHASDLTGSGQIMGTIDYMSPEQALNTRLADQRSDIYSFGCTLWYLLTGRSVYDGDTALAKLLAHRDQPIPPLLGTNAELNDMNPRAVAIDCVIRKMLAKRPDQRYQSMAEVLIALEGCLTGKVPGESIPQPAPHDEPLSAFFSYLSGGDDSERRVSLGVTQPDMDLAQLEPDSMRLSITSRSQATKSQSNSGMRHRWPTSIRFIAGCLLAGLFILTLMLGGSRPHPAPAADAIPAAVQPPVSVPVDLQSSSPVSDPESASRSKASRNEKESHLATPGEFRKGYQLAFDGESSYAVVESLKYEPDQEYTIECWLTLVGEQLSPADPVIWTGPRWIAIWEQHRKFGLGTTGTGPTRITSSFYTAPPMVPIHVAGVWSAQGQTLYVDGRQVMTSEVKTTPFAGTSGGFFLGGAPRDSLHHERWFRGGIDEVRISQGIRYRSKTFQPERRIIENDSSTLALYHMDEGFGDQLIDSSGHGHHGQIIGAKWIIEPGNHPNPLRKYRP